MRPIDLSKIDLKGFSCFFNDGVILEFQRVDTREHIVCEIEMVDNGDLQYMIDHGWTLSPERIKKAYAKAKRRNKKKEGAAWN